MGSVLSAQNSVNIPVEQHITANIHTLPFALTKQKTDQYTESLPHILVPAPRFHPAELRQLNLISWLYHRTAPSDASKLFSTLIHGRNHESQNFIYGWEFETTMTERIPYVIPWKEVKIWLGLEVAKSEVLYALNGTVVSLLAGITNSSQEEPVEFDLSNWEDLVSKVYY